MKPEVAERLFIEELFHKTIDDKKINARTLSNIDRLTGDASTRRYYRLESDKESYVVCLDNPTTSSEQKNSFVEVQKFLSQNKIRVPEVYDVLLKKGYILEEDLGDITLLQKLSNIKNKEEELQIYKKVIGELVKLHSLEKNEIDRSGLFHLKFDYEKLSSEIEFTTKFFLKLFLKIEDDQVSQEIFQEFIPICERLASQKMVLTHRDFHSRNIMCKHDKELIVIDFQDARMGIPQYDLASILDDCYYEIHPENKRILMDYYFETLGEERLGQDREKFECLYLDMVLQRAFKAIGSFSYIYNTRKDERYLKYIGFAMEKIRQVMFKSPRYDALRTKLFKVYYES